MGRVAEAILFTLIIAVLAIPSAWLLQRGFDNLGMHLTYKQWYSAQILCCLVVRRFTRKEPRP